MKRQYWMFSAFWMALLTALFFACDHTADDTDQGAPALSPGEIRALQNQNSALKEQNSDLQTALHLLRAEVENLKVENRELSQWSRALVQGYGPCVWYIGRTERPVPQLPMPSATAPGQLLEVLNKLFDEQGLPTVVLSSIINRTAMVTIPEAEMLTQRMGTTGADAYMNAVAFTLCSLDTITCVSFQFQAGSHAVPGKICP